MYSEALAIMDKNTVEYMIDGMRAEIRKNECSLQQKEAALQRKDNVLQQKEALIRELPERYT